MSNKTCTCKTVLTYTDEDGVARSSTATVAAPYQGFMAGSLDIPDLTPQNTVIDVPFGTLDAATVLELVNKSGQELALSINGSAFANMPDGSSCVIAAAALPGSAAIASASVETTADPSAGAGSVSFKLFGDPV